MFCTQLVMPSGDVAPAETLTRLPLNSHTVIVAPGSVVTVVIVSVVVIIVIFCACLFCMSFLQALDFVLVVLDSCRGSAVPG